MIASACVALAASLCQPARADDRGKSPTGGWPSMREVWDRSRAHAPAAIQSGGAVSVARSTQIGARMSAFGNPYLEVTADRSLSRSTASGDVEMLGQLFLPIEVAGQRGARIRESDAFIRWRELERVGVQGRVGGAALFAYGRALASSARIAFATRAEDEARRELSWIEGRSAVKDATVVERGLAEAEVGRHAQLRAEAEIRLLQAQAQLTILTGMADLDAPESEAPVLPALASDSADFYAQKAESAPILRAYEGERSFWMRQVDRSKTERWPAVSLIAQGGRGELGEARVGGGLAWAFPFLRRNQGAIAQATTQAGRASTDRSAIARALEANVRSLVADFVLTRGAIDSLDHTGLPAAERLVDYTFAAFRAGKTELVRVLIARRDLALARARRLDLVENGWRAYGELAGILGALP
jgi:outer membrane protein, heavy metal efflux system